MCISLYSGLRFQWPWHILNVRFRLPFSKPSLGSCDTEIFMLVRASGGSIDRNIRGIRCERAKGLNLAEMLVMKFDIMVAE